MDQQEFNVMENMTENVNPFAEKIKKLFSSNAFLTATIAYTVLAGASVVMGTIDVFTILFAIGMWLSYTAAKTEVPISGMKFLSGTLKAYYIVSIVAAVCLLIAGVLCIAVGPHVMDLGSEFDVLIENAEDSYSDLYMRIGGEDFADFDDFNEMRRWIEKNTGLTFSAFIGIVMIAIGVIFIISTVVVIIVNEFFVKKLRGQLKNTVDALKVNGAAELNLGGIRAWFIVLGVFASISAASVLLTFDLFLIAGEAAGAVAYFALASALSDK